MSRGKGTCIAVRWQRQLHCCQMAKAAALLSHWHGRGTVTMSQYRCVQAEDELEHDGRSCTRFNMYMVVSPPELYGSQTKSDSL